MLEKPDLDERFIFARLAECYHLRAAAVTFLPLGADINTAVYRVAAEDGRSYFLKLRRGDFDELAVAVPHFLHSEGIRSVIDPITTVSGKLHAGLEPFQMILYPFVNGRDAYQVAPSDRQLAEFGAAMRRIHAARLPEELRSRLPREEFSPRWRMMVRQLQAQAETSRYDEPVAARFAAFLREHRAEVDHVVRRAEELAGGLHERAGMGGALEYVLCHADIHAGNLLLAEDGSLYIVDWDNPILAPAERDLMHIGGGVSTGWNDDRAAALFYSAYNDAGQGVPPPVDRAALAYYRYERIVQDFAAYGEQLLLSSEGGEDRKQGFRYFTSNFQPGGEIENAIHTDPLHG